MSIAEYASVENWRNNLRQSSIETYLHYLKRFCDYAKLNPDQLVEEAKKNQTAVHNTLKAFRRKLETEGGASSSLQIAYMAGRSFLKWNGVKLDQMPRSYKGRVRYESGRLIEPYEVAKMISYAKNVRDKAIVSFLYQSGQRVGVLTALRYRHVRAELEKDKNPVVVEVEGELVNKKGFNVNKASAPYRFAIGRECADFLRQMIQDRRDAGEPIDNDTWLFRNYSERLTVGFRRMSAKERGSPPTPELISDTA